MEVPSPALTWRGPEKTVIICSDSIRQANRKAYGPDDFQSFGQLIGNIDEVPGKTDEIGLLFMDGRDDVFGETNISPVMQIGDMNKLTRRSRYMKIKPR